MKETRPTDFVKKSSFNDVIIVARTKILKLPTYRCCAIKQLFGVFQNLFQIVVP